MNILLSNDDGVNAPGLAALHQALLPVSKMLTVVAPDRNCSGASNALTLTNPLRVQTYSNGFLAVNGTPSDCVQLGISQLLAEPADMVIAGINDGANLGDDVIYSGTVAAATEGRHIGLPAIAVSLCRTAGSKGDAETRRHYATAAAITVQVVLQLKQHPLKSDQILNINVPDLPISEIKGFKVTRLGRRHQADPMTLQQDPWGRNIYWYGPLGKEKDAGQDTDFYAVANGFVSVTPLTVDMTAYEAQSRLEEWLLDVKIHQEMPLQSR